MSGEHEVTRRLGAIHLVDRGAREALVPVVYSDLRVRSATPPD